MVVLPDGKKTLRICITVYTQYRRVTDGQTDIFPGHSSRYAYASRGKNGSKTRVPSDYTTVKIARSCVYLSGHGTGL